MLTPERVPGDMRAFACRRYGSDEAAQFVEELTKDVIAIGKVGGLPVTWKINRDYTARRSQLRPSALSLWRAN